MNIEMVPYLLLLLAILAGWLTDARVSILFVGIAVAAGLVLGRLMPISVIWILTLGLSLWLPTKFQMKGAARLLFYAVALILSLAMLSHRLPGFNNLPIYENVQFSVDSIPFTMFLNFDQTIAGLLLYLFFIKPRQPTTFGREQILVSLKVWGALSALIFTIVLSIQYVRFDVKFPELGWIWILNNLFFVCLAEEALFRGFIQNGISAILPKTKPFAMASIALASTLFGLAHYQGGVPLIGLATVAGLFFGYAYDRTKRIESAIIVHFGLNLIHFVFFSYPALIAN